MTCILPGITTLLQHINTLKSNPQQYSPVCCPNCGQAGLWCHGFYFRKSDRTDTSELNPIPIPRFYCRGCRRTCSVLPECIPPLRWYLWSVQQIILTMLLLGKSLHAVSQLTRPNRSTAARWWSTLKNNFSLHRDAICATVAPLGRTIDFNNFWQVCLQKISLSKAMHICNLAGVAIP